MDFKRVRGRLCSCPGSRREDLFRIHIELSSDSLSNRLFELCEFRLLALSYVELLNQVEALPVGVGASGTEAASRPPLSLDEDVRVYECLAVDADDHRLLFKVNLDDVRRFLVHSAFGRPKAMIHKVFAVTKRSLT